MKTNKPFYRFIFFASLAIMLSTSCRISGPRTHHVPLFEEKGEMQIAANVNPNAGGELQVDYAVGKKTYLMSDFSYNFPDISDALGNYHAYSGSLGVGRFRTYGNKGYGRFSYYGGATVGHIVKSNNNTDNHLSPFLGVDWGMARPKFETALSFKFSQNLITDEERYLANELAWTTRFGGERLKFQTQFGGIYKTYEFPEFHFTASFGFTYRLRTIKK